MCPALPGGFRVIFNSTDLILQQNVGARQSVSRSGHVLWAFTRRFKGVKWMLFEEISSRLHRRIATETLLSLRGVLLLIEHNHRSKRFQFSILSRREFVQRKCFEVWFGSHSWLLTWLFKSAKNTTADADKNSDKRSIIFLRLSETYFDGIKTMWEYLEAFRGLRRPGFVIHNSRNCCIWTPLNFFPYVFSLFQEELRDSIYRSGL